MVLIFSTPSSAASRSKAAKIRPRKSMVRSAVKSWLSVVNPTRSQNRMVASAIRSAITISPLRMRLTMLCGRMFRSRVSERSFSCSRSATNFFSRSRSHFFSSEAPMRARSSDRIERLGQIILGAGFDAAHDAVDLVERGNHDDRDVAGLLRRLEPAQHLEAAHFRHDEIEQDEVELLAGRPAQAPTRRSWRSRPGAPRAPAGVPARRDWRRCRRR